MTPTDIWNAAIDAAVKEYKRGLNAIRALKKRPEVTIDGECEEIEDYEHEQRSIDYSSRG